MRLTRRASELREKLMAKLAHDLRVTVPQLRDDGLSPPVNLKEDTAYPYEVDCWEDLIWYAQCPVLGLNATGWSQQETLDSVRSQIAETCGSKTEDVRLLVKVF